MKGSTHLGRTAAGIAGLLTLILGVLWILDDPREALTPRAVEPPATRETEAVTAAEPMELPTPAPHAEPRELSAVPIDGDRSADAGLPGVPRSFGLRHPSGAPASGLRVAFQRRGITVSVGETDVDGRVTFTDLNPAAGPPTGLWIGGVSGLIVGLPVAAAVPVGSDQDADLEAVTWVDLPAGNELYGTVTVDGLVPTRLVDLALTGSGSKWYELPPDEGIRQRLARPDSRMSRKYESANAQRVTPDGRFRFSGLADDWSGRLTFSNDLYRDPDVHPKGEGRPGGSRPRNPDGMEGLDSLDLQLAGAQGAAPLRLALRTRPLLRGRAVQPDGAPAAGAALSYVLLGGMLGGSSQQIVPCDAAGSDGRFAIPCTWQSQWSPRLTVLAADGRSIATLDVPEAHRANGVDLGDVFLQRARSVTFRALDRDGAPIAGALAVPADGSSTKSRKTDADGLSVIDLALDTPQFTVHALEYESAEVVAPGDVPGILDVVLDDCCVLRLRVANEAARPPSLLWKISSKAALFTRDENFGPDPIRVELGMPGTRVMSFQMTGVPDGDTPGGPDLSNAVIVSGSVSYVASTEELALSCLEPHVVFDVALTDVTGDQIVWEQKDLSLAPGEDRLVVARTELRSRRFAGRVLDPQGRPIEGARLYVGPAGAPYPSLGADTDADGRFAVDDLLCDAVDFDCAKNGYLTITQSNVPIPPTGGIDLTLQPSRVVEVEISSAEALGGTTLNVLVQGSAVFSSGLRHTVVGGVPTRPHRYAATVEGVAGEQATLQLVVGDRTVERTSPADESAVLWDFDADG